MIARVLVGCLFFFVAGCANPMHDLRNVGTLRHQVNNDLMARTDNTLSAGCHELTHLNIVNWDDGLSEEEAAAISLWNNPTYQTLLTDLQIARADLIEAAQVQNPQAVTMIPAGPKQWEFTLNVPLDVLWLRPIRVAAAQLESHRVGIAVRNGIMMVSHYRHLETEEGMSFGPELILRGAEERLSPILMTALTAALALVPLIIAGNKPGHEIEYPMALVIVGGLLTSTLMNLFLMPTLYYFAGKAKYLQVETA